MQTALRGDIDGTGLSIGIVVSRFNDSVCDALRDACEAELGRLGVDADRVLAVSVPGALEIPVVLKTMASSGAFDALIALGAVIRGETYHFELVCNESARGLTQVSLEYGVPIANGILTTETDEQAAVRAPVKGAEAAQVAVEMARVLSAMDAIVADDRDDLDED